MLSGLLGMVLAKQIFTNPQTYILKLDKEGDVFQSPSGILFIFRLD